MIYKLIHTLLELYKLALIAYVVLAWLHVPANRWTELLRRVVEPALNPVRVFLRRKLPAQWQIIDWSPVALWLLIGVVQLVIRLLLLMIAGLLV